LDALTRLKQLLQLNDISLSIRHEFSGSNIIYRILPNSLSDLTRREFRFAHTPLVVTVVSNTLAETVFPHPQLLLPCLSAKTAGVTAQTSFVLQGDATGEDIVLSNVLAFDVQAYDPYARIWPDSSTTTALVPSDRGYLAAATGQPLGLGCYVDLGYYNYANTRILDATLSAAAGYSVPYFADAISVPPAIIGADQAIYRSRLGFTYDTWALHYERDGIFQLNEFSDAPSNVPIGRMDMQTNGIDDNGINGVDDAGERETVPPYSQPLRGLQVKIRLYEPSTRQVRQATVATDFITE
jgi:hypothetical protein